MQMEELSEVQVNRKKRGFVRNGIDRKDNLLGYTPDNSVSCCAVCNHAKHTMSEETFTDWIKKAYMHLSGIIFSQMPVPTPLALTV